MTIHCTFTIVQETIKKTAGKQFPFLPQNFFPKFLFLHLWQRSALFPHRSQHNHQTTKQPNNRSQHNHNQLLHSLGHKNMSRVAIFSDFNEVLQLIFFRCFFCCFCITVVRIKVVELRARLSPAGIRLSIITTEIIQSPPNHRRRD